MRPGLAIEAGDGRDSVASLVPQGRGHEENGLELAWLEKSWRPDPPLLAAVASNHRFGGWFAILAEYCSNGRLVLVLDGLAASRFRHERPGWCSLAKRPENHGSQERLAITPHSAQIETLVWLTGCSASDAASRLATSGDSDLTADDPGDFDDEALVGALHAHEGAPALDTVLRLPRELPDASRARVARRLTVAVRPRAIQTGCPTVRDSTGASACRRPAAPELDGVA